MDYCGTASDQLAQGCGVLEVALDQLHATGGEVGGFWRRADQGPQGKAPLQQPGAQGAADKPGRSREGDGAALREFSREALGARNQAEATLMRNSSVTAFRFSGSWELMKSMRALARDSLPDEVLGREWMGTSST